MTKYRATTGIDFPDKRVEAGEVFSGLSDRDKSLLDQGLVVEYDGRSDIDVVGSKVEDIVAWVGDDPEKAAQVVAVERMRLPDDRRAGVLDLEPEYDYGEGNNRIAVPLDEVRPEDLIAPVVEVKRSKGSGKPLDELTEADLVPPANDEGGE